MMNCRGIRGATTVPENSSEAILEANLVAQKAQIIPEVQEARKRETPKSISFSHFLFQSYEASKPQNYLMQ